MKQTKYALAERADKPLSDLQVSMSNRVARASHDLRLSEKRLIAMALAKTDSASTHKLFVANQNSGWKVKLIATEFAELFNIDSDTAYTQLKEAGKRLFERYIRYTTMGKRGKPIDIFFRWVSSAKYAEGEGWIELNFTPEIAPHVLGLGAGGHFTTYKLKHSVAFDSIYAWRLYELLKSWMSTGRYEPLIDDFHHSMETPESYRKDFKATRLRVIEPAVRDINAKSDLLIQWNPVRYGSRKVSALEFRFMVNPQQKLEIE